MSTRPALDFYTQGPQGSTTTPGVTLEVTRPVNSPYLPTKRTRTLEDARGSFHLLGVNKIFSTGKKVFEYDESLTRPLRNLECKVSGVVLRSLGPPQVLGVKEIPSF